MKTCKEGHEYDGQLHGRCPVCQSIYNANYYAKDAGKFAAKRKAAKEAVVKIEALEKDNEELRQKNKELSAQIPVLKARIRQLIREATTAEMMTFFAELQKEKVR